MQEAVMYVNAIDEINQAQRGRGKNSADRLRRAHETAEAAWAAIPRDLREKLIPPPARPGSPRPTA
jgi:hypothetical protein